MNSISRDGPKIFLVPHTTTMQFGYSIKKTIIILISKLNFKTGVRFNQENRLQIFDRADFLA